MADGSQLKAGRLSQLLKLSYRPNSPFGSVSLKDCCGLFYFNFQVLHDLSAYIEYGQVWGSKHCS